MARGTRGDDKWAHGGVLIFDREGNLKFALSEDNGKSIHKDIVKAAIKSIIEERRQRRYAERTGTTSNGEDYSTTNSTLVEM